MLFAHILGRSYGRQPEVFERPRSPKQDRGQ